MNSLNSFLEVEKICIEELNTNYMVIRKILDKEFIYKPKNNSIFIFFTRIYINIA